MQTYLSHYSFLLLLSTTQLAVCRGEGGVPIMTHFVLAHGDDDNFNYNMKSKHPDLGGQSLRIAIGPPGSQLPPVEGGAEGGGGMDGSHGDGHGEDVTGVIDAGGMIDATDDEVPSDTSSLGGSVRRNGVRDGRAIPFAPTVRGARVAPQPAPTVGTLGAITGESAAGGGEGGSMHPNGIELALIASGALLTSGLLMGTVLLWRWPYPRANCRVAVRRS